MKKTFWKTEYDNGDLKCEGMDIWALMTDMRVEVEHFVSAYALDAMYDTMRIGLSENGDRFYWLLRDCGTWFWSSADSDAIDRLEDYKRRYSNRRIFTIERLSNGAFSMELIENTFDLY